MAKKVSFEFTPSKYQQDIFDFVQHSIGNAVINAKAGSGKSSTMVAAIKLVPKSQRCLFIAFNRAIVEDLSKKLENHPNCHAETIHSLGYSIIKRNFGYEPVLDEYKYRNYLKQNICELSKIDCETMTRSVLETYMETVSTLINFARFNLCQTKDEIMEVAKKYSMPILCDECEVALKCMEWGKQSLTTIDYTDMVWLPYELSLSPKGHQYDWVMFDEAQDASKAYVDLFLRVFKRGTRFIAVADPSQSINQFAGSSSDAFDYLSCYPHTREFDLPICYRCDRKIVQLAQNIVPEIKIKDNAEDGVILYDCSIDDMEDGDMVLCRAKSPLVRLYVKLIKKDVNCYIKGQDIGINLIELIRSTNAKAIGRELLSDGLFIRLYERLINERNIMMQVHQLDLWDASLSLPVMNLYDEINAITILSEGCNTVDELIERIENIFKEDEKGICLSTIHKAKGLENDNVYILCWSMMPSKRATKDWELKQERNLQYVAITRAKHKLGFVSEREMPPSGTMMSDDSVVNEIVYMEKCVCRVLGKPMTEDNLSAGFAKFRLKAATPIEDAHADDNVVIVEQTPKTQKEASLDDLLDELS